MSDWKDVMEARRLATAALAEANGGTDDEPDLIAAVLTGVGAVCAELRALGTTLDFAVGEVTAQLRNLR